MPADAGHAGTAIVVLASCPLTVTALSSVLLTVWPYAALITTASSAKAANSNVLCQSFLALPPYGSWYVIADFVLYQLFIFI